MSETNEVKLAAPGAGLPLPELWIARTRFALKCRLGSREAFASSFEKERQVIRSAVASVDESARGVQVLIRRPRGLEDSSRNWSLWMTLDHLRITNHAFAGFISRLADGEAPKLKADTAAVKPDPAVTREIEQAFEDSCEAVLKAVAEAGDLKTSMRHPHPWFGPLDAYQWLGLAAMHMSLHRVQIKRIIAGQ